MLEVTLTVFTRNLGVCSEGTFVSLYYTTSRELGGIEKLENNGDPSVVVRVGPVENITYSSACHI